MLFIDIKVIDFLQSIVNFLLRNESLKIDELNFLPQIFRQPSFGYYHILINVPFLELHNLPIVWSILLVHITKFIWHLSIDSALQKIYFRISIKSLGVKYFFVSSYFGFKSTFSNCLSIRMLSSRLDKTLLLILDRAIGDIGFNCRLFSIGRFFELLRISYWLAYDFKWVLKILFLCLLSLSRGFNFSLAILGTKYFVSGGERMLDRLLLGSGKLRVSAFPWLFLISRLINLFELGFSSLGSINIYELSIRFILKDHRKNHSNIFISLPPPHCSV